MKKQSGKTKLVINEEFIFDQDKLNNPFNSLSARGDCGCLIIIFANNLDPDRRSSDIDEQKFVRLI